MFIQFPDENHSSGAKPWFHILMEHPLCGDLGQTRREKKKKVPSLTEWADKRGRQRKRRKGWGLRTHIKSPSHQKYTVLGIQSNITSEKREMTRTCSRQYPKITATVKKQL